MNSIFHSGLANSLSLMLNDSDDFNVIIHICENKNTKEFKAHSVILWARSPYFKSAFSNEWITKKNNMIMFNKPNITPIVFEMIIKYIYIGGIDLTKQTGDNILELLIASDELLLEELFKCAQDFLIHIIEKQQNWFRKNFIFIVNTVFKLADYEDVLYCLLKRDDLHVEKIVIWDCLIKWGIEQTGLNSNRTKWDNEDYEALKKILSQLIPLIRFIELYPDFDKISPYKTIIPNNIYEEIEESYHKGALSKNTFLSSRAGKIKSEIIKPKIAK
ncbi:hypothetical protein RclHR1_03910004 [Rhizophagus clarus]|uniref:BTB domain-containing protein n=1 Tax=Rhizophagus clarus TaxID=94130 RepID=A0A2Z6S875_9GLOM|nr:hypothetical protein RclHR1_03910004 [Rhizophagus clarus]GES81682.1 hypothetical protein GLOIN_2v1714872 [Rhizophagus clarus]